MKRSRSGDIRMPLIPPIWPAPFIAALLTADFIMFLNLDPDPLVSFLWNRAIAYTVLVSLLLAAAFRARNVRGDRNLDP